MTTKGRQFIRRNTLLQISGYGLGGGAVSEGAGKQANKFAQLAATTCCCYARYGSTIPFPDERT